jgi:hypothetical protein
MRLTSSSREKSSIRAIGVIANVISMNRTDHRPVA